ncbi:MAG: tetratricopeptide repeat protein [Ignavibacteriales bacterium]|nr:tetratricopeptide repeat protein [Ignavibacteriales bacterium]
MIESNKLEMAQDFLQKAYKLHLEGKIIEAIDYYKISIDFCPTAEAHTFLGWAYSMQGKFNEAIEECCSAIIIDEDYGNPYNDIGSYLVSLEKYDDSIQWFEKAIKAARYNLPHLPYYNLGKVFEKKGDWFKALKFYKESVKINPKYEPAQKAVVKITTLLN